MAIARQTMTDEQRKSVALEYLKAFDNKGVTSSGGSILDLFADDAQVFFPKWGLATGKKQIGQLFTDFGGGIKSILHDYATFNWIMTGTDVFAVEGTSAGDYKDGPWRAGVSHAGRWCDVFEIRDFLIQRCFIYLDPDYAGLDTSRYHWLSAGGRISEIRLKPALAGPRSCTMRRLLAGLLLALSLAAIVHAQGGIASAPAKFLVPSTQVVAIRAGRLFDSRTGIDADQSGHPDPRRSHRRRRRLGRDSG